MVDKAHKTTDKILFKLERELRKIYSISFLELKKISTLALLEMNLENKDLTPIQRYNNQAINIVNKELLKVYKTNYNSGVDELAVLLAISIPKRYSKDITNTKAKHNINETPSPFNVIALDEMKASSELRRQVSRQFTTSIMQGKSLSQTINELKKFTQLKMSDIDRIARTQTTRMENMAKLQSFEVAKKMGYEVYKTWVCVGDNRTRPAHKLANNQTVEIDEPFVVDGEKLMYPGDPNGSAKNIINCRCYIKLSKKPN